jgi:ubiquinone biosynthesis protein COQ9
VISTVISPAAERERDRLIEAILPDVAFDGWSFAALRVAAAQLDMPAEAARALFRRGAPDLVAGFSRWADRQMLDRLSGASPEPPGVSRRVASALCARFEAIAPWREAVRHALSVLALPPNTALGLRLLYETVDDIWYAVGDNATDFSFYTKRATLAAIQAAASFYWLDDRSAEFAETRAFIDRRLADVAAVTRARRRVEAAFARLPNPLRILRPAR